MKTFMFCLTALSAGIISASATKDPFIAHEWGTFTSVQGADGIQMQWNPLIKTDLPGFVYSRAFLPASVGGASPPFKDVMSSFVRMETPVIYFYSDNEITADVRVLMPQGRITEWYPRATRVGPYATTNKAEAEAAGRSFIEWSGVKVLPRETKEISSGKLIREKGGSHYYEARETDANFVRVASPYESSGAEYERDLFYRGIGYFKAPLTVQLRAGETELELSTSSQEPLTDLFVLTIRHGMARYQYVDALGRGGRRTLKINAKSFSPLTQVRSDLMREMAGALARHGLYAREAQAMVKTWQDQWFAEEGTRVLYVLPRSWTDQTLPLTISPRPADVVRVMVGRSELITPTMELALKAQAERFSAGDVLEQSRAVAAVRKLGLGRFLEPATRRILGEDSSKSFAQAAWRLAQEASKPSVIESAELSTVGAPATGGIPGQ